MDQKSFAALVERAEKEPDFLHKLTFKPEEMMAELRNAVGREALGSMIAKQPGEVVARTIGINQACGNTCSSSCDNTCGGSCGFTTNLTDFGAAVTRQRPFFARFRGELSACGNTCSSSCDNTCGSSCGFTTNLTDFGRFGQNFQTFR